MPFLKRYPVLKTMSAYFVINALADFNEQVFIKKRTRENYKYAKTARITFVGTFVISPFVFGWIRFAEKILPGRAVRTVVFKVLLDQIFIAPLEITTFYISTNILEGKKDILEEWRQKFLKTYTTGLWFWPLAQAVNFAFIPLKYRTSCFMPLCSLTWTTYLCYMKELQIKKFGRDDTDDQTIVQPNVDNEKASEQILQKIPSSEVEIPFLSPKTAVNFDIVDSEMYRQYGLCSIEKDIPSSSQTTYQTLRLQTVSLEKNIYRCSTDSSYQNTSIVDTNSSTCSKTESETVKSRFIKTEPSDKLDMHTSEINGQNRNHPACKNKAEMAAGELKTKHETSKEKADNILLHSNINTPTTKSTIKNFIDHVNVPNDLHNSINDTEEASMIFS